jgi:hypothetical protein
MFFTHSHAVNIWIVYTNSLYTSQLMLGICIPFTCEYIRISLRCIHVLSILPVFPLLWGGEAEISKLDQLVCLHSRLRKYLHVSQIIFLLCTFFIMFLFNVRVEVIAWLTMRWVNSL